MGVPTGEEVPNPELVDFTRRFWVGAVLTLPVFLLAMAPHVGLPLREWLGERTAVWAELILSTPVVLLAGCPFFLPFWFSLLNRSLNIFTLIALFTSSSYVFCLSSSFSPLLFPSSFLSHPLFFFSHFFSPFSFSLLFF